MEKMNQPDRPYRPPRSGAAADNWRSRDGRHNMENNQRWDWGQRNRNTGNPEVPNNYGHSHHKENRGNYRRYNNYEQNRNFRKPRMLGYRYLQGILENDDLESAIIQLTNDRAGFKELLDSELSNDLTVLLVKLLAKMCNSNFVESKLHLLQIALQSNFVNSLIKFISTLALQTEREKMYNSHFWKDPSDFCNNVLYISRTLNDLIPTTSYEYMLKILMAMKLHIPLIENHHSISISDIIKNDIDALHAIIEKISVEVENKSKQSNDKSRVVEPPNDFKQINVYPTVFELTSRETPFLRPNIIKGPYENVNHYLDVQFRLLREDFVAPLRNGICQYMQNPKAGKLDNIKIYKHVRFLNTEIINEDNCFRIQYDFRMNKHKTFNFEHSRRFMFGSLLCFTNDHFKSIIFGKIAQRNIKDLEQGQLIVGFDHEMILPENIHEQNYLMVESSVYFEPYFHVLNVLKTMNMDNFPMEKHIIKVETDIHPPQYLLQIDPVFYEIEEYSFWPLNWDDTKTFYGLNNSQSQAFKAALTKEFSIIQGPPGTGKTFLGLKIAETLLANKSAWYNKTPMLVICYTNHALDQFLEGLLEVCCNILRIGGQSKNEKLINFNIKNFRGRNPTIRQMRYEVKNCHRSIPTITETLELIDKNEAIVDFTVFSVIPSYKESWFYKADTVGILKWLLNSTETRDYQMAANWRKEFQDQNISNNGKKVNTLDEDVDEDVDEEVDEEVIINFKPIISLKSLQCRINELNLALNSLERNRESWNLQDMLKNDQLITELNRTIRDFQYLQGKLQEGTHRRFLQEPYYVNLQYPHYMDLIARWQLYWFWLDQYKLKLLETREKHKKDFPNLYKRYNELCTIEDAQIMKNKLVVGITTTGAARLQASLQALKSPIVIIEEAAEVLEAHIISSLTKHCQHLILIGDHQQLKPSTANFKVETKYQLGISLFERMVLNQIDCHTLNIQHRMRPEISCLIHPTIYPLLEDHESVLNRPPILGVENCVYFIDHQEPEQVCSDESKKNIHEAKFVLNFAKYLILNGYDPNNITILATYLGQMFEMQREKKYYELLQDVRIAVLDNYQGEENDIILLSLVRSNEENKIGFLKIENRVCVALSRARNAFYMIGNMTQLCNNSDIWPKVKESLVKQNAFGPHLTLRCQIHRDKITEVSKPDDFMNVAEGGCNIMCEAQIDCGHICTRICHIDDRSHTEYKCREKCNRVPCNNNEEHLCKKLCHEECGPCMYKVEHNLNCGHTATIDCYIDPAKYNCTVLVKATLPCEHEAEKPCYKKPEEVTCPHPCDVQVQPCGHACTLLCHIKLDPDHLEYHCMKPCARTSKGCSLRDDKKHLCEKLCFEECQQCNIKVKKHRTICSHTYEVPCKTNVDEIECKKPCTKTLPCGHKCKNKCDEPCGSCNVMVTKIVPDCNHKVSIQCSQEPNRKFCNQKCPRLLPCGHKCMNKRCSEDCISFCNALVECSLSSPCGHTITKIQCSLKEADNSATLLKYCTEKCNTKLKCGHVCPGTCGDCFQGRIHQRCQEKCGVPLVCNHECTIPCRQACKPCKKPCTYSCAHSKCRLKCGEICTKCQEPCKRACDHQRCGKKCGDICDIKPCYEPCRILLKCKHPCVGFCGDPCPVLCRICNYQKLTEIFLGNEDEENAIYVMLIDCKHVFESNDLERWLNLNNNEVKFKVCPRCKTIITKTIRYNEYIKRTNMDIANIKKQLAGTDKENNEERKKISNKIEVLLKSGNLLKKSKQLEEALKTLKGRLQISKKKNDQRHRQAINKMDLTAVKSKLEMIDYLIDVCGDQMHEIRNSGKSMIQISFILDAVMRVKDDVTGQEIDDITLEIERLSRSVQLEKIIMSTTFNYAVAQEGIKSKVEHISEMVYSSKRYCKDVDAILQTELSELNKQVNSSELENRVKREIVAALGLKKGHWFKCPNGHYYAIGECGGANEISKCNECGSPIGGTNHRLLPNQSHAYELDNSLHPAWSEAANLANYRI